MQTNEILETIKMIDEEYLDIRTVTIGISLLDCIDPDIQVACKKVEEKICRVAKDLVPVAEEISRTYGIPIVNKRIPPDRLRKRQPARQSASPRFAC